MINGSNFLKSPSEELYWQIYLSVDQWDADPIIVKQQAALCSVVIQLLQEHYLRCYRHSNVNMEYDRSTRAVQSIDKKDKKTHIHQQSQSYVIPHPTLFSCSGCQI